jgi:hypothetical protein
VICPHCSHPTGVAPDRRIDSAQAAAILATDPLAQHETLVDRVDPLGSALAAGAAAVVEAVVETVRESRERPKLPAAVAHVRRRHVVPNPSTEPEKTEPAGEEPRFLK